MGCEGRIRRVSVCLSIHSAEVQQSYIRLLSCSIDKTHLAREHVWPEA